MDLQPLASSSTIGRNPTLPAAPCLHDLWPTNGPDGDCLAFLVQLQCHRQQHDRIQHKAIVSAFVSLTWASRLFEVYKQVFCDVFAPDAGSHFMFMDVRLPHLTPRQHNAPQAC